MDYKLKKATHDIRHELIKVQTLNTYLAVGAKVGLDVGAKVGDRLGAEVGPRVGDTVGS